MHHRLITLAFLLTTLLHGSVHAAPTNVPSLAASWIVRRGSTHAPNLNWSNYVQAPASMKFVDPTNGQDSSTRNGTASQSWRTPGYAIPRLQPGDVLNIHPGEYLGVAITLSSALPQGTPSAPIVVRAFGQGAVVFKASTSASIFDIQRSYWVIEGITLDMNHRAEPAIRVSAPATHVVIRGVEVKNSAAGSAININTGAQDIAVIDSRIHDTWKGGNSTGQSCTSTAGCTGSSVCDRAAGVCRVRDDGHGVFIGTGVSRVLLRDNVIYDNSGDGVQCEESLGGNQVPRNVDVNAIPRDVLLEGNTIYTSPENWGHTENAIDLKACRDVSVRNSPLRHSSFHGFRPSTGAGANSSSGTALVVHFEANNVLIEDAQISNSCNALSIGRAFDVKDPQTGAVISRQIDSVQGVTFRRNTVYGLVEDAAGSCSGKAVQINRVDDAELFNNTFRELPATALTLASGIQNLPPLPYPQSTGVKVSSNIFHTQAGARWVTLTTDEFTSLESRNNLFWSSASQPTAGFVINNASATTISGWRSTLQAQYGMTSALTATERELNPLLAAQAASGFPTQSGSPARDASEPRAGEPHCGGAMDVGAYESDCNQWVHQYSDGGPNGSEVGRTAARAPDGSIYVAGNGEPTVSTGTGAVFLMKLDGQGNVAWARRVSAASPLRDPVMAVDSLGEVYLSAFRTEAYGCDFMGNCSQAVFTLVFKFDASGQELWRKEFGARGQPPLYTKGITVHGSSAVYVVGVRGWYPLYGPSNQDGFLIKLDATTGNEAWTQHVLKGPLGGVATSASGQVFVAGSSEAQVELTPSPSLDCTAQQDGWTCSDMYVALFNSSGNRLWVRRHGGVGNERPTDIAIAASGELYVAGTVYGNWAALSPSTSFNVFAAKLDGAGTLVWARQFGGAGHDEAGELQLDASGALYIASTYHSTFLAPSTPGYDALVLKYSPSGELQRGWVAGTTAEEQAYGLVLDGQGFITTGGTKGSWGAPIVTTQYSTNADAFIASDLFLR